MRETDVIDRLRARLGASRTPPEGIGDDAAVLRPADGRIIAVDTLVEGVHFDLALSSLADAAFKALAVNVSDLWAMGAEPTAWLLSVGLRPELARDDAVGALAEGFAAATEVLGLDIELVGGDTVRSPGPLVLSVTMIGHADGEPLTRSGAIVGQQLFVDGPVGHAAAGLALLRAGQNPPDGSVVVDAHRRPRPGRLRAADARSRGITSAIDISDGLVRDAERVARASGVGIELSPDLPGRAELATSAAVLGIDPLELQLHGGDDYVRLVTADDHPGPGWSRVGRVVSGPPCVGLARPDGTRLELAASGFDHFPRAGTG